MAIYIYGKSTFSYKPTHINMWLCTWKMMNKRMLYVYGWSYTASIHGPNDKIVLINYDW